MICVREHSSKRREEMATTRAQLHLETAAVTALMVASDDSNETVVVDSESKAAVDSKAGACIDSGETSYFGMDTGLNVVSETKVAAGPDAATWAD